MKIEGLEFGSLQGMRELECESAKHVCSNVLMVIDNLGGPGAKRRQRNWNCQVGHTAPACMLCSVVI